MVLDYTLVKPIVRELLAMALEKVSSQYDAQVISWTSFKPGTFQEQFSIRLKDGTSFWIGSALNSMSTIWGRYRMEFNPNKVGNHAEFKRLLGFFALHTSPMQRSVKRFDLAIDIPIERENCFLVKDRRMYIERRHGKEYTQYLGSKASTVGRVKLYNKQLESGLDYPLTRLELTLDPEEPFLNINFPKVFYQDNDKLCLDGLKATDTERFILNALLQGYGTLNDLGRKTRAKMEKLMAEYVHYVEITETDYAAILDQLHPYLS